MDFFDFIRELRKGKPDVRKAEKAMKILAWICIIAGLWNFIIYFLAPFKESPFNLPPQYPYLTLLGLLLLGTLFFRSARGIKELEPWGKKTGQIAIALLIGVIFGFMFFMFPWKTIPLRSNTFPMIIFVLFAVLFAAQFIVPAYFGIRYLGRLPVKEDGYPTDRYRQQNISMTAAEQISQGRSMPQIKYKDALFPFGPAGIFALLIALPLLSVFILEKYARQDLMPLIIMPMFLFIFLGDVIYNYLPSSFQRQRKLVASFTGGGSIFLLHGSPPFFRLLIYSDGLEVRFMFHRFFIPYDEMDDIPDKVGFLSRGILIKSDLPDVPSGIRFSGFGMKKIVKVVNETRRKYLAGHENKET